MMKYLNLFFNYIIWYAINSNWLLLGCWGVVFCELGFIYYLLNKKFINTTLKIYNFYLNAFYVLLYFNIFVAFVCFLRYVRWGFTLDLLLLFETLQLLVGKLPKVIAINFLLLALIILLLLNVFKKFFYRELLKFFIYYYHRLCLNAKLEYNKQNPNKNSMTKLDYPYVIRLYKNLQNRWVYDKLVDNFVFQWFITPYCTFFKKTSYSTLPFKFISVTLKYLPLILFVGFLFYDCLYNSYKLHLIFYYLPFYFLYHLWCLLTSFISNTNDILNSILYNMYYEKNIKYVGVTITELEHIELYIKRNCRCISVDIVDKDIYVQIEKQELIQFFGVLFIHNRQFVRLLNSNIFENPSTGDTIKEEV